jgi:hypothetical protein
MFERIGRAAEKAAGGVDLSRRGFLGRLSRGALVAAGAVAGLLAAPQRAQAGRCWDCYYTCDDGSSYSLSDARGGCGPARKGCHLVWKLHHSCY